MLISRECDTSTKRDSKNKQNHRVDALRFPHSVRLLKSGGARAPMRSALRPEDASITDSLGWALYKRGRLPEAIETLSKAAAGDPSQAEIHEHLGDALFSAGRRIEARFSWQAALVTAEDKAKTRLEQKLEPALNPATAAP